jgi:hypothetical protein
MIEKPRSAEGLTTLDAFLDEPAVRGAFRAVAIKEVLAWRMEQATKERKPSRERLAERMGASRKREQRNAL